MRIAVAVAWPPSSCMVKYVTVTLDFSLTFHYFDVFLWLKNNKRCHIFKQQIVKLPIITTYLFLRYIFNAVVNDKFKLFGVFHRHSRL